MSFETGLSDFNHLIYTILKTKTVRTTPKIIKYRSYRKFSSEKFLNDLRHGMVSIPQGDFYSLHELLSSLLNIHAPTKTKVVRGNHKPYFNKNLSKAIMERSRLKNLANKTKKYEDYLRYKRQRNFVCNLNRKSRKSFFTRLETSPEGTQNFWKTCKPLFSKNSDINEEKIFLTDNNTFIYDDFKVSQTFNTYFVNITKSLPIIKWNDHLPSFSIDSILRKFEDHPSILNIKGLGFTESFQFSHVYPWETWEAIENLNPKKSTSGNIPTNILKLVAKDICIPLTDCINNCINDGVFPDDLKLANVIPIHKGEDSCLKENYRPISLLPAISKVVEKLLANRINAFMESKLSKFLCGFRSGYSTQHALFRLLQKWQSFLDKSGTIGSILMDLSKAFDSLPHDLLIAKLAAYGFHHTSLKLLLSYLSNRFQRTKVGSKFSDWLRVILGVPQGSILGPLLFNIFINDLLLIIISTEICNFADDNTLYSCHFSLKPVLANLEIDLRNCLKWYELNQLAVNPKKFQLIILGVKNPNVTLNIGKQTIKCSDYVKLLGVYIDSKLKFDIHINNICTKANMKINCLYRIRKFIGEKQAMILANAYVLSHFKYCPLIWMFCSKTLGNLINRVHRRCLKAVYQKHEYTLSELLSELNQSSIHTKHLHSLLVEVFKSLNGLNPEFMQDYFRLKQLPYALRKSNLLTLPATKTKTYGTNSVHFQACLNWNKLPTDVRNSSKINSFKNLLSKCSLRCSCRLCSLT